MGVRTWRGVDPVGLNTCLRGFVVIPVHDSSYTGSAACTLLDAPAQGFIYVCVCVCVATTTNRGVHDKQLLSACVLCLC